MTDYERAECESLAREYGESAARYEAQGNDVNAQLMREAAEFTWRRAASA